MRLVYPGGSTDWALLDTEQNAMRHLAGNLAAWAPRVAFGEGRRALPLNGRVDSLGPTSQFQLGRHFRRLAPGPIFGRDNLLAAVIGAAPLGLPDPRRRVVGYVAVRIPPHDGLQLGTVLVTSDEFGPHGPDLCPGGGAPSIDDQIATADGSCSLRTGDVVVVGRVRLTKGLWAALHNHEPDVLGRCSDGRLSRAEPPSRPKWRSSKFMDSLDHVEP